jgi:HNH endonuclease
MNTDQKQSRFLSFVNKQSGVRPNDLTTDCWVWTGGRYVEGYGQTRAAWCPDAYAHRTAYILFVGEIPDGKLIRHRCDNRGCVNPDHLVVGGKKENNQDARERNPRACGRKVQPSDYPAILERWGRGELLKDIAKEYGMNPKSLSRAIRK